MRKKVLLAIAFVAVAMVSGMISGGIVLLFEINQASVKAKSASQEAVVEVAQLENEKMTQVEEMTFSCGVSGCTQTAVHEHGLCGIDGCTQIGEHNHGVCDIAGCTETGTHIHNKEYYYPHSADDGHAYHTCGVSGCTEKTSHTHGACGIDGCTQTGDHSHGGDHENSESSGEHHKSSHGSGHH